MSKCWLLLLLLLVTAVVVVVAVAVLLLLLLLLLPLLLLLLYRYCCCCCHCCCCYCHYYCHCCWHSLGGFLLGSPWYSVTLCNYDNGNIPCPPCRTFGVSIRPFDWLGVFWYPTLRTFGARQHGNFSVIQGAACKADEQPWGPFLGLSFVPWVCYQME